MNRHGKCCARASTGLPIPKTPITNAGKTPAVNVQFRLASRAEVPLWQHHWLHGFGVGLGETRLE